MSGESREEMETRSSERLPPIVTSRHHTAVPDPSLAGAPLPPYRRGLYAGALAPEAGPPQEWSESSAAAQQEVIGPRVEDGWPDSWREDPEPATPTGTWVDRPVADAEPDETELLVLEEDEVAPPEEDGAPPDEEVALQEAEIAGPETERDPTGYEQAAEDLARWEAPTLQSLDAVQSPWGQWDADEAAVYDLPGAAGEDTGPWQDSWAEATEVEADEPELSEAAVENSIEEAGAGEETGELIEMVEEPGTGPTLEFAPADEQEDETPADAAWAPFETHEQPVDEIGASTGTVAADTDRAEATTETQPDERVAIVPPTPLDSWYHGEHAEEAEATWEAFGRALEEAASWGDLGATIATGLGPEEARGEAPSPEQFAEGMAAGPADEAASQAPPHTHVAEMAKETPAPSEGSTDPAMNDLARRLEQLAQRLRTEGEKGVEHALTEGDRLEASLAGFIAGYVAARRG